MNIAFIGVGNVGARPAAHLDVAGHDVIAEPGIRARRASWPFVSSARRSRSPRRPRRRVPTASFRGACWSGELFKPGPGG